VEEPTSPGSGSVSRRNDGQDMTARPEPAGSGDAPLPARQQVRAIDREQFEEVIRRAAELSLRDADAREQVTEAELLRIASELGLPAHHVQRALFELPELKVQPRWYDRYFGNPVFSVGRVVPSEADLTLKRVEEYLVTREYLQIVRRRAGNIALIPADDTISSLARTFFRSGSRHHIARASRVLVSAHPVEEGDAHVRVDVDLNEDRRSSARGATWVGSMGGVVVGGIAAHFTGIATPAAMGAVPEVLAFGAGMAGTFAAVYSSYANSFRNRIHAARLEITGLLDRLEQGERLDPPPAPWRRRLSGKLRGDR
jgi:hypothetical protein